jgi:alkylation response protein AidB-like acyl-CoA dehydrogenase
MDFEIPEQTEELLEDVDTFIESELSPLAEGNEKFFDRRWENARTNWDDGTPTEEWLELRQEVRRRADEAGIYRLPLPEELGGENIDTLTQVLLVEHLAEKGPGLHNIVANEGWQLLVGDFRHVRLLHEYGTPTQQDLIEDLITGDIELSFGLSEPGHGSDATSHLETTAEKEGDEWIINGQKRWIGYMNVADYILVFARTSGEPGDHTGVTCFLVPTDTPGLEVPYFHWTMVMPTVQAEVELNDVRVPDSAIIGEEGQALSQIQGFVYPGRLRQAARSVGTAQFCIDESVEYAKDRETWGESIAARQGVQFPVVDIHTEIEMVRNLLYKTAWQLDEGNENIRENIAMTNYRANQVANKAADQAIQVHGGKGYTRHEPFELYYRISRRYRITEGTDEIQKRIIGGRLFDFV